MKIYRLLFLIGLFLSPINQALAQTCGIKIAGNLNYNDPFNPVPGTMTFPNLAANANFQYTMRVSETNGKLIDVTFFIFSLDRTGSETRIQFITVADGRDIIDGTAGAPVLLNSKIFT